MQAVATSALFALALSLCLLAPQPAAAYSLRQVDPGFTPTQGVSAVSVHCDGSVAAAWGSRLAFSRDGYAWSHSFAPPALGDALDISLTPGGSCLLAGSGGIYRGSPTTGWSPRLVGPSLRRLEWLSPTVGYAVGPGGIYRTLNDGLAWSRLTAACSLGLAQADSLTGMKLDSENGLRLSRDGWLTDEPLALPGSATGITALHYSASLGWAVVSESAFDHGDEGINKTYRLSARSSLSLAWTTLYRTADANQFDSSMVDLAGWGSRLLMVGLMRRESDNQPANLLLAPEVGQPGVLHLPATHPMQLSRVTADECGAVWTGSSDGALFGPATAPYGEILSPQDGAVVGSPVKIYGSVSDTMLEDWRISLAGLSQPYERTVTGSVDTRYMEWLGQWDDSEAATGRYRLDLLAGNRSGGRSTSSIRFWLDRDGPMISSLAPDAGSPAGGRSLTVSAVVVDGLSGVSQVWLAVDGVTLAVRTAVPYSTVFDSTRLTNGHHCLSVAASDRLGNRREATGSFLVVNGVSAMVETVDLGSAEPGRRTPTTASTIHLYNRSDSQGSLYVRLSSPPAGRTGELAAGALRSAVSGGSGCRTRPLTQAISHTWQTLADSASPGGSASVSLAWSLALPTSCLADSYRATVSFAACPDPHLALTGPYPVDSAIRLLGSADHPAMSGYRLVARTRARRCDQTMSPGFGMDGDIDDTWGGVRGHNPFIEAACDEVGYQRFALVSPPFGPLTSGCVPISARLVLYPTVAPIGPALSWQVMTGAWSEDSAPPRPGPAGLPGGLGLRRAGHDVIDLSGVIGSWLAGSLPARGLLISSAEEGLFDSHWNSLEAPAPLRPVLRLSYLPAAGPVVERTVTVSSGPVSQGRLADWDTTGLPAGEYELELSLFGNGGGTLQAVTAAVSLRDEY